MSHNLLWEKRRSDWVPRPEDARSAADVDYARVVHSGSFRRLQGKTQILNLGDSDFYRTRLTHSLEVGQISMGITRQFQKHRFGHEAHPHLPDANLIHAISLAHDLGHAPFGHGGEVALNYCMRKDGGFEGNGQTLRILSRLENFSEDHGADLSRRALLGVLKYPVHYSLIYNENIKPVLQASPSIVRLIDRKSSKPPKCFLDSEIDIVDWILDPFAPADRDRFCDFSLRDGAHGKSIYKSFDCSIMEISDDIAYGVHDLEDAIALGLISEDDFSDAVKLNDCETFLESQKFKYKGKSLGEIYDLFLRDLFSGGNKRKHAIGRLVHYFITNADIGILSEFENSMIRYQAFLPEKPKHFLKCLQDLIAEKVIRTPQVQHLEFKGQMMVLSVFEVFQSDPKSFLPADAYGDFKKSDGDPRVICDHVAGMTDGYLLKTYDRLFSPRMGSVFDKL